MNYYPALSWHRDAYVIVKTTNILYDFKRFEERVGGVEPIIFYITMKIIDLI